MGLVDPSLRKKEHGPQAAARKAQRFYNSVVHGVPDQKAEQQETSNMTQSLAALNLTLNLIYVAATPSRREPHRLDAVDVIARASTRRARVSRRWRRWRARGGS